MAGAYAMDAVDDRDRARVERHLARCQECSREISGLREATARLAAAAAAHPAAALKDRLLAETALVRQFPPVTRGAPDRPARHRDLSGRARSPRPPSRRPVRMARVALALAGVFVIAAVAVWAGSARLSPPVPAPPRGQAIAAVLTAPDATMISARVRTGGAATVVMSHRERTLVFAAAGLRALPASRRYELWVMGPHRDRPAGHAPRAPARHDRTGDRAWPGTRGPAGPDRGARQRITAPHLSNDHGGHARPRDRTARVPAGGG